MQLRIQAYFSKITNSIFNHLTRKECLCLLGLFLFFIIQKLFLFQGFQTNFWDQYFFDHGLYNVAMGNGWVMNHAFNYSHFFTLHFQPIYYLIVPLYFILASPIWLFILQSFCLTMALVPVIKFAKYRCPLVKDIGVKLVLFAMLIYVPFRSGNLVDLHAEVLLLPLFSWIGYFLLTHRYRLAIILSLFFPLFKENMIVYYFGMAIFFLVNKQFRRAAFLILYGLICTIVVVKILMPMFGLSDYYHLNRFSYLNPTSISDLFKQMLFNPHLVIQHLLSKKVIDYLFGIFGLLFFYPLFSKATLIASGVLLQNCLSDNWGMLLFTQHYSLTLVPILLMASVDTYSRWLSKPLVQKVSKFFLALFLCLNLLFFIAFELRSFIIPKELAKVHTYADQIPTTASVCASSRFAPHFFYHRQISEFPKCNGEDVIFLEKINPYFPVSQSTDEFVRQEWAQGNRWTLVWNLIVGERISKRSSYQNKLDDVGQLDGYALFRQGERFIIYKKNNTPL